MSSHSYRWEKLRLQALSAARWFMDRRDDRACEALRQIANDINNIGLDNRDAVLRRITERMRELLNADVCLIMLRDERMGCWVVEAASGKWHEKLQKSVMLWEEFPVSVHAFETNQPAIGEYLRSDLRPEAGGRNLIGESMLALPLVSRNQPFGVLVFLKEHQVPRNHWNLRLAQAIAAQTAIAIVTARLYETALQKEKGLSARLKHLEHLAEMLAHDMKAPGERLEGLAELLVQKYSRQLDEDARRLLLLIRDNSKELTERVEMLLELAQVGSVTEVLEAVDPTLVINDILKARAVELAENRIDVHTAFATLAVPSHRAYLRQIFDNLISNAIKYSQNNTNRAIKILSRQECGKAVFSVIDNGPGIPLQERDRVFEPFVRLNPKLSKGTGIGLTIAKRIVEWHGGRIWIDDRDTGCTVTFTLPLLGDLSIAPAPSEHVRHAAG